MQRVRATEAELPLPKGVRANARCRLRRLEAFGFALPHDFPTARFCKLRKPQHISHSKWKTVYHYFRKWRLEGDWQRIHEQLRQWVRAIEDRHPSPSAAQSHSAQIVVFDDW